MTCAEHLYLLRLRPSLREAALMTSRLMEPEPNGGRGKELEINHLYQAFREMVLQLFSSK